MQNKIKNKKQSKKQLYIYNNSLEMFFFSFVFSSNQCDGLKCTKPEVFNRMLCYKLSV